MSFEMMAKAVKIKTGSAQKKLILLLLADRANEEGYCYPSLKRIAEDCELTKPTIVKYLKQLEIEGLLTIKRRTKEGASLPNHYYLHLDRGGRNEQGVVKEINKGSKGALPEVVKELNTNLSDEPIIEPSKKNKQKKYPTPIQNWLDYKKSRKEKLVDATIERLVNQYNENPIAFAEKVEHSIASGYQGLFAPKTTNNYKQKEPEVGSIAWRHQQQAKNEEVIDV